MRTEKEKWRESALQSINTVNVKRMKTIEEIVETVAVKLTQTKGIGVERKERRKNNRIEFIRKYSNRVARSISRAERFLFAPNTNSNWLWFAAELLSSSTCHRRRLRRRRCCCTNSFIQFNLSKTIFIVVPISVHIINWLQLIAQMFHSMSSARSDDIFIFLHFDVISLGAQCCDDTRQ